MGCQQDKPRNKGHRHGARTFSCVCVVTSLSLWAIILLGPTGALRESLPLSDAECQSAVMIITLAGTAGSILGAFAFGRAWREMWLALLGLHVILLACAIFTLAF